MATPCCYHVRCSYPSFSWNSMTIVTVSVVRWVLGEWTPCSVTCGEGIQTRELTCKQEISATLTMRVNEAACLSAAPSLPRVRNCNLDHCAKWHTSEWGKVIFPKRKIYIRETNFYEHIRSSIIFDDGWTVTG